ncbi:MAG TPA: class I SAM-dependent methyltransferase [Gammaproteobacteria bacterium]|nr:class I SAM-dependent methyltransferase [Gammaproteobacteria bacterium]
MPTEISWDSLDEIERGTLDHYEQNAESFWEGTRDHDVSQNIEAFLHALPKDKPLDILDFGCGPGRDICIFKSLGHRPVGLDGSKTFCQMARKLSGCPVLHQQFLKLALEEGSFDGVFANASLFHIPSQELPRILGELHRALRPGGILFSSNPRGDSEGWQGRRYGHYMEFETSATYLKQSGFKIIHHYYRPHGKPRDQQPWLAIVSQRQEGENDF